MRGITEFKDGFLSLGMFGNAKLVSYNETNFTFQTF